MIDRVVSRVIFCDDFGCNFQNSLSPGTKLSYGEESSPILPDVDLVLDFWIPSRHVTSLLEEFECMLETARLLDLTSRPFLEFVNSVFIYTFRFTQRNSGYERCLEVLVRDAYKECVKLPKHEGLKSKIITDLSQFVIPRPNIRGMPMCDSEEAISLTHAYFKHRGITRPDISAKIEQIELLEAKILISDLQALDRIPLLCEKYVDFNTTDTGPPVFPIQHSTSSVGTLANSWQDRNEFLSYIKSANAEVVGVVRCAVSPVPVHCVWLFTKGQLDFGAIKPSKSAFQPLLDMVPLGKSDSFNWAQFSAMRDKINLLYPLERLPEYSRSNYVDSYFKILPRVVRVDSTNYSPLKIKIAGLDGFKFTASELRVSNNIDKDMLNYHTLEDRRYELSKQCGVVTFVPEGENKITIDRNLYPSITPRYTIAIHGSPVDASPLLEKCAEFGIKNLTFIVEAFGPAMAIAKSLCADLEKRTRACAAPWYDGYFGIHLHAVDGSGASGILEDFVKFLDGRSLVY